MKAWLSSHATCTSIGAGSGEYLNALVTRFTSTWRSRFSSPSTKGAHRGLVEQPALAVRRRHRVHDLLDEVVDAHRHELRRGEQLLGPRGRQEVLEQVGHA